MLARENRAALLLIPLRRLTAKAGSRGAGPAPQDFSRRAEKGRDNYLLVKKRRRIAVVGLILALLAVVAWFALRPREPEYQGRHLGWWLQQTGTWMGLSGGESDLTSQEIEAKKQQVAVALREMGTNALPLLVQRLVELEEPNALSRLVQWFNERQEFLKIGLPRRPPWAAYASEAFRLLNTNAIPAIPELAELFQAEPTSSFAGEALLAIGEPSLPVFVAALTNQSARVRRLALQSLGEFGPASAEAIPLIVGIAAGSNPDLSGIALRVLSEVETNCARHLPLLEFRLFDTNHPLDAAFVLGRMGPEGVPLLARALTNESRQVRIGALAALQPEFAESSHGKAGAPTDYGFSRVTALFNLKCILAAASFHERAWSFLEPAAWARVVQHPDAGVQRMAVDGLKRLGFSGATGLSFATEGENSSTRRAAQTALQALGVETYSGAITRGSRSAKRLAMVFTGHEFGEGGDIILTELARRGARGSFFLTGEFLTNQAFAPLIERVVKEGHYLGPHSDKHLLYCAWERGRQTLVSRQEFRADLAANIQKIKDAEETYFFTHAPSMSLSSPINPYPLAERARFRFFLPPFEHYNAEVAQWTLDLQCILINFTPGTRSNADYTGEADTNFVSSQAIFDSIVKKEREDPHGLNGFILLLHLGSGPGRKDKFHYRFGELLDYLAGKGYQFVRVDELLEPKETE